MFSLFTKKLPKFSFETIGVDMHSHLLPGIDDGSKSLESSIEMIQRLQALGYRKLITTPHILGGMYNNTPETILPPLALVQEELKRKQIDIELSAAAEYYADEHLKSLLTENSKLLPISGNKILIEFSMAYESLQAGNIIFDLQARGYQPIIAHPERYIYLENNKKYFEDLVNNGCLLQLNFLALTGHYGKTVLTLAMYILEKGWYSLIGSDVHSIRHIEAMENANLSANVWALLKRTEFLNQSL